jgi:exopolysaccharide biosynthesis polyprenyl glycosylphosphotransferase
MNRRPDFLNLRALFLLTMDFICLEAALLAAYALWVAFPWHGNYQAFSDFVLALLILPPIGIFIFQAVGLYQMDTGLLGIQEQSLIFKAVWILYLTGFVISFFYREVEFSRLAIFYSLFLSAALISLERFFIRHFFERLNQQGIGVRYALIYGAGYHGQRLERWIRLSPRMGIRVIGFLDDDLERLVKKPEHPACIGGFEDLRQIVKKRNVKILFIAHRKLEEEGIAEILQTCRELEIQCWMIPAMHRIHIERFEFTNIGGVPLVGFRDEFGRKSSLLLKEILDRLCAIALMPVLIPVMAVIVFAVWVTSGRPVFFKQTRIGKNGKKFEMIKFRSLKKSTPRNDVSPELKKGKNTASTPLGPFLRRTGLDELPQIFNVLAGEMSFVGPRPEMPFIVEKYGALERERLTAKPGITGLWQISEDRKRLFIHENMDYDLYYVEHMSFNLDLAILLKTVLVFFRRFTARPEKKAAPQVSG